MPWTATIISKDYNNGTLAVSVLFTDSYVNLVDVVDNAGKPTGVKKYLGDPQAQQQVIKFETSKAASDWPDTLVQARLDELAALEAKDASVVLGPFTPSVPITPSPDPASVATAAYVAARNAYYQKKGDVDAGIAQPSVLVGLLSTVQTAAEAAGIKLA